MDKVHVATSTYVVLGHGLHSDLQRVLLPGFLNHLSIPAEILDVDVKLLLFLLHSRLLSHLVQAYDFGGQSRFLLNHCDRDRGKRPIYTRSVDEDVW